MISLSHQLWKLLKGCGFASDEINLSELAERARAVLAAADC
jgi:hypothetical protein